VSPGPAFALRIDVSDPLPSGQTLVLAPSAGQHLAVIDGSDASSPTPDTALGYANHLSISGSDVYLSQGDGGVQHMTLP
jgi:hypothetical protein